MAFDKSGIAFPITLDVKKDNSGVGFVVGQYDKDSKYLEISLTDDGLDYTIPVGATASLNGTKPISSNIFIDTITIEDNKLYIYLTEQACLMNGYFPVDITLYSGTKVIKIPYFMMTVTKAAVSSDAVVSADEVNVLNALILEASAVISDGNNLIDSMTALEGTVDSNEDARVIAEGLRVTAESNRVSAELLRVSAESGRVNAESDRVIAELARVNAEIARASAEVLRQDAITGEAYRIANEVEREEWYDATKVMETYNPITSYVPENKVTYGGSTWRNKVGCTGVTPVEGVNWTIFAQKGIDGAGGNMNTTTYDPTSKAQDMFAYSDNAYKVSNAETFGSGVLYGSGLFPEETDPQSMAVMISSGTGYFPDGSRVVTSERTMGIMTAHSAYPRKDTLWADQDGLIYGAVGTPSATPVAPVVPYNCLGVAEIYVGANVTLITNDNITDLRQFIKSNTDVLAYSDDADKLSNAETVGSGILYGSGGLVTAQSTPNMTVAISACTAYMPTGERAVISAVASQTITTADATNPRKDIMYVNSSKVTSYLVGTASTTPTAPSLPSGGVLLAEIYVGAGVTSITNANITDKRSIIKSNTDLSEFTNKASLNGVNPSTSTDMTSVLNSFFNNAKSKGAKYVNLDKAGKYRVDGVLDKAKDLILIGNSEIEKNTFDNYYVDVADSISGYQGKINSYNSNFGQFKQFGTALSEDRNIKVCFFTDSMGFGNDVLGITYNSGGLGYTEASPDGLTTGDSYYYQFIDMITKEFPDKVFDFYNRGIGGTMLSEWDVSKTFNSVSKTWIEHIKDTSADLLVIGFGMNHSWYAPSVQMAYEIKDVTDYITANFTTKPDLAWVTSPRPVLSKDGVYGDNTRQFSIDNTAQSVRSYAKEIGGYILDAGKLSNIKRTGKSYLNPYFKAYATTEAEVDVVANGTYIKSGSNYVMDALNEYIDFDDFIMKDFIIEFNVSFSSFTSSDDCLGVYYNKLDDSGTENRVYILPNASGNSGNGQIKNYGEIGDSRWGGLYSAYNAASPFTSVKIKIEKREDVIDVYVNDVRVIRDSLFTINNAGNIKLICFTSVGTISLSNIKLYKGEYETYLPELTETDMWGTYTTADDTSTKLPTGGNGVNHPSNIAISEVYVPIFEEFVDDIRASLGLAINGSNANGSYVKLPDGTAMFHTKIVITGNGDSWYSATNGVMPIAINDCILQVTAYNSQYTYLANGTASTSALATSTTAYRYGIKFPVAVNPPDVVVVNVSGIGRWK